MSRIEIYSCIATLKRTLLFVSLWVFAGSYTLADEPASVQLPSAATPNSYAALSNEELLIRAEELKDSQLTQPQRTMNFHWLSQQSGNEKAFQGGRAFSKLLERKLKVYLDERDTGKWLRGKLLPQNGRSSFVDDMDYDLKVRSDEFVIGISYEF